MRLHLSLPAAARLRVAAGLAALLFLLTGCGPTAPVDRIPGEASPVAATASPSPSVSSAPLSTPAAVPAPTLTPPAPAPGGGGVVGNGGGGTGGSCTADEYRNVDGVCVPRPIQADAPPPGATAQCNDGTYSFSQHRSGTCSHHGGVRRWL